MTGDRGQNYKQVLSVFLCRKGGQQLAPLVQGGHKGAQGWCAHRHQGYRDQGPPEATQRQAVAHVVVCPGAPANDGHEGRRGARGRDSQEVRREGTLRNKQTNGISK